MRTKRRKNPYIVFCKAKRDELKEKNKDMKPKEIQSKLAELWRALSEDEKAAYKPKPRTAPKKKEEEK